MRSKKVENNSSVKVNVRIPKEVYYTLISMCTTQGIGLSKMIVEMIKACCTTPDNK